MNNKKITAKIGLSNILKTQVNSPAKAKRIKIALGEIESIPNIKSIHPLKIRKIADNVYSYRVDSSSRIIFGENDNKRVLLDYIDTNEKINNIKRKSSIKENKYVHHNKSARKQMSKIN